MKPSYQLTDHPIGSIKEIWTLSWPLMLGLLSGSFMLFVDRLLLSNYSLMALNAAATAGMATYVIMIIPVIVAGISEVFVGRFHGSGQMGQVGKPVWQMVWLSWSIAPLFFLSSQFLPPLFFHGTGNEELETIYFQWIIYFAPFFCSTVALIGFFVGIGNVKIVTFSAILGNIVNVGLDYVLIFGSGFFPEMGIKGAALGTGLSQLVQTLFLLSIFLKKSHQIHYGTSHWRWDLECLKESLRIGVPAALGKFFELISHFIFFRIVLLSGSKNLTIITIIQSFYLLIGFIIEGLSKGFSSITANLIGGGELSLIRKVLHAAMKLHTLFFLLFGTVLLGFGDSLLKGFVSNEEMSLFNDPQTIRTMHWSLFWMVVFFLLDGFGWIFIGLLTASGDTKFLLYASFILNWVFYIAPAYITLELMGGNAVEGWMIIAFYALITYLVYYWRYRSGRWLPLQMQDVSIA